VTEITGALKLHESGTRSGSSRSRYVSCSHIALSLESAKVKSGRAGRALGCAKVKNRASGGETRDGSFCTLLNFR
jgi:hypothetical protein